ncbi:MAG TPA: FAD/NAD(P)-binding protein [Nocardioides sp.]|uniref:FAD/NAD(P)-binding protein n=1 Tax=Nocardioides sp. TaxID=35761 RepID=UPI002B5DE689|nr:FAD/NAD(P)-binding protein [Nocardioides sp.]HQR27558.1 FAD/NAD(P)-binding protein [Nocardioides sp.]
MQVPKVTRPTVVVIGAGASGTLAAIHLLTTAGRRATAVDLVLVDPADRWGRGVAFGTPEREHLLNVPASGMSALPEDPGHFVAWLARQSPDGVAEQGTFAPRRQFALYLDDTLADAVASTYGLAALRHVRSTAVGVRTTATGVAVATSDGRELAAEAAVVATGLPEPGCGWVPAGLASSAFFVPDPWRPGALDVVRRDRTAPPDVLLVGTGLTMVDVTLSLTSEGNRPDRRLVAFSRHGRLPRAHTEEQRLAVIPDVSEWGTTLAELREDAARHVAGVVASTGDWRPAVDGLRFQLSTLWNRLSEEDRAEFLARDAGEWAVLRHRMPPATAAALLGLRETGRLTVGAAEVTDAEPLPRGGLRVRLSDGTSHDVGWVVNCTGPQGDLRQVRNPLLDDLQRRRGGAAPAVAATGGMGFRTDHGRLVDSAGTTQAPIWTLGPLRRGELWESTAVPEIRSQARVLAGAVLDAVAPLPRRLADGRLVSGHHPVARPRDPLGLPISTTADAAASYNAGLERVLRLQSGGDELIREATVHDPGFALAHAALALLAHEGGSAGNVVASLKTAQEAVRTRGDAREVSLVDVVTRRVRDTRGAGNQALMAHIAHHPRDVLAVSAAVPTIAFSGVTDVQQEAWDLVEGLGPAFGDHWWYASLLAFTRQEQGRYDEAGLLAESALSCEPSSGHAVHALSHVLYETGQHEAGRVWLDHWVTESGRSASHRAHFSWHAALHELTLGDTEAVRRRYYSQLAPPSVTGVRGLVDSASLLWRWRITTVDWDRAAAAGLGAPPAFDGEGATPPADPVLDVVPGGLLGAPETPFAALHAAFALAAAGRSEELRQLREHCARSGDGTVRTVVAVVCDALSAVQENQWNRAWRLLAEVMPVLVRVGGSAAQRELVEETLLFCLVNDGQAERAAALLDVRLDRRPSPLDRRRLAALARAPRAEIAF